MKFLLMIFLLLSAQGAFSSEEDCEEETPKIVQAVMNSAKAEEAGECPNKKKLTGMCMFIGSRTKDPNPISDSKHMYYRRIMEASCVDTTKDTEKTTQEKIKKMWAKFDSEMTCDNMQFDVTRGNYFKYAVATRFDEFLENVADWQVNLNKVDPSDNRTVLDYIKHHMEQNKGNSVEKKLKYYYDLLREAGAKHKSEL